MINFWPELFGILAISSSYLLLLGQPKWLKLVYLTIFISLTSLTLYTVLGSPRPAFMAFQDISGELIGYKEIEGQAIYVYMNVDGVEDPLSFRIPWDIRLLNKIEMDWQVSMQTGRRIKISLKHHGKLETIFGLIGYEDTSDSDVDVSMKEMANEPPKQ